MNRAKFHAGPFVPSPSHPFSPEAAEGSAQPAMSIENGSLWRYRQQNAENPRPAAPSVSCILHVRLEGDASSPRRPRSQWVSPAAVRWGWETGEQNLWGKQNKPLLWPPAQNVHNVTKPDISPSLPPSTKTCSALGNYEQSVSCLSPSSSDCDRENGVLFLAVAQKKEKGGCDFIPRDSEKLTFFKIKCNICQHFFCLLFSAN